MSLGRLRLLGSMGRQEYWDAVNGRQTAIVRALKPFPGCFMQRSDWYGDIWGEVVYVWDDSVTMCYDDRLWITPFYSLRGRVEATPPLDARILYVSRVAGKHYVAFTIKTNGLESAVSQWKDLMVRRVMVA